MEPAENVLEVKSSDGTRIAYEVRGDGPPLIWVGGAFNGGQSPAAGLPLAELLAPQFTVVAYDRRGRGGSGDSPSYSVEREIEDLAAIAAALRYPPYLFGHSSGAALAIEAVADGMEVKGLAVFEPPYATDQDAEEENRDLQVRLQDLLRQGLRADAAHAFLVGIGMPAPMVDGMKTSPVWPRLEALAPTLAYDLAVLRRSGTAYPPLERVRGIKVPFVGLAGARSPTSMRAATRSVAAAAPVGRYVEIPDVDHAAPAAAIAPGLLGAMSEMSLR